MNIKKELEAMIYLATKLNIKEAAKFYKINELKLNSYLEELKEDKKDHGINLNIQKECVFFETNPKYGKTIHKFFHPESNPKKLSKAAIETLSIIAYKQPITRSQIESIRAVSVDGVVQNLEKKGLIYASGKDNTVGKPNLYSTTTNFLDYLNISDLSSLPNYSKIRGKIGLKK